MTILVSTRARLLAGVATSVFAAAFAGGVSAGSTTIPDTGIPSVVGHKTVLSEVVNTASIDALIEDEYDGIVVVGTQSGTTNTVTENVIEASSTSNAFNNSIDLSEIANDIEDGVAALSIARNLSPGHAQVDNSGLVVDLLGFESGAAVNNDNTIAATMLSNTGSTVIAGTVPGSYASTAAGASASEVAYPLDASGSIVASSSQTSAAGGASALITGSEILLLLSAETDNNVDASPTLDGNTMSASAKANSATTGISIEAGDAPDFTGSAVVTNLQFNGGTTSGAISGSRIAAEIVGEDPAVAVNDLDGGLSVQNNAITASATGNEAIGLNGTAGNSITVGDQLAVNGAGTSAPGVTLDAATGSTSHEAAADFIVVNAQENLGTLQAQSFNAEITGYVQSLQDGAITVAGNETSTSATGNTASNGLTTGDDLPSFAASVAMANDQAVYSGPISALTQDSRTVALTSDGETGVTSGSTVTVDGNRVAATAYGNDVSQSVALDANTLNPGYATATVTGGVNATDGINAAADGIITVTNLQSREMATVSATVTNSEVGVDVDTRNGTAGVRDEITDSTLATTLNRQEAVALGSSASNGLSLTGNTVGTGAAVTSVQTADELAAVSATLQGATTGVLAGTHVNYGTVDVSDNLQRAIAYSGSASNGLSVEANTLTGSTGSGTSLSISGTGLPFYDGTLDQPTMNAALGVLNDQSALASVSANADLGQTALVIEGDLLEGSATVEGNAIVGAAYGLDAANTLSLDVGGVDIASPGGAFAQISNTQAVSGVDTEIGASAYSLVRAHIEDDVTGSSLSASSNTIQAQSIATQATNALSGSGNAFDTSTTTGSAGSPLTLASSLIVNDAALGVTNAQSTDGLVTARLTDTATGATDSAKVLTTIGTDTATISNATIASDGNSLSAAATANAATNSVAFEGNAIASETGLLNFQVSSADMSALIGVEGMDGAPGGPFNYGITGNSSINHDSGYIDQGELYIAITGNALTTAEVQYLLGEGWALDSVNDRLVWDASATPFEDTSVAVYTAIYNGGTYDGISPQNDVAPDFAGTPNVGGVTIVADSASIANSTLSVDGNAVAGSVTGNSAANTLAIDAGAISSADDSDASDVQAWPGIASVDADHALSNVQAVDADAELASAVYGNFGIETAEDVTVAGTSLSVSDNSQRSVAVANTAANALSNDLSLDANSISAGSGLLSQQSTLAAVSADSDVDIFAPAAVAGSSVDISGNTNTALAVGNDVTNSSSVTGTTLASLDSALSPGEAGSVSLIAPTAGNGAQLTGDHLLVNLQSASGDLISSAAETTLSNWDASVSETTGLSGSSFTLSGNATYSEASANRASNTLTLDASSLGYASAGMSSGQVNASVVTATASTSASLSLNGGSALAAISNSTVAMDGNSTTALARGNSASNVLNVSGGAGFGTSSVAATAQAGATEDTVTATYGVLNHQSNTGVVTATSQSNIYRVAYVADAAGTGALDSSISVSGNRVASEAYGNSATNAVVIDALNGIAPTAAVANHQTNSTQIVASVYGLGSGSIGLGVTGYGGTGGTSLGVTGNTVSARAVGNSATNAISSVSR